MNKQALIAALSADDFDKAALLEALTAEAEKVSPFRDRPAVREHIDAFNTHRKELFQPSIYKRDGEALALALKTLTADLEAIAAAAGVDEQPAEEPAPAKGGKR